MIRRPPRSTLSSSSAASDVYKRQAIDDARATLELLAAMEQEEQDLERYVNLFGYNPRFGLPKPTIHSVQYLPQGYNRTGKLYEDLQPAFL